MSYYNRHELERNTRATAEEVNAELIKVKAAFDQVQAAMEALSIGAGLPSFTWIAYADSIDGTANFTTGEPGNREYIGIATNKTIPIESTSPDDYTWSHYKGGIDGTDGVDGDSFYVWIAYADKIDGTVNFTTGAPGGRHFIGIAANKLTPTESTNPADYQWSQYSGPPNFGLVATAGAAVAGNRIIKTSGAYTWGESVYSSESYAAGAFVSFRPELDDQMMIGLNTDPATDASYTSIDYAIYIQVGHTFRVYESGVSVHGPVAFTAGDTFAVQYDNNNVYYSRNGIIFYQHATTPNLQLFLDSSMVGQGTNATIISFSAGGRIGPAGDDGPPLLGFYQDSSPGAGAFVNQTWYRPSYKEWFVWNGSSWVRLLGDVSALSIITDAYISTLHANKILTNTITANKFLTDAGVDRAAVVPGSLNAGSIGTYAGTYTLNRKSNPGDPPNEGAICYTATITATDFADAIFINWGGTFSGLNSACNIYLQVSVNGGGWTTYDDPKVTTNLVAGFYNLSLEFQGHTAGTTIQARIYVQNGSSTSAGNGQEITITDGFAKVRRFFAKS
ncbi:hypothetical protein KFK14_12955 [Sphingobium phenoxybenzoativorans]|uniref:Uncharacterized protein n=1 Tax=Sphingobium phenoxybenzoativorans TaxID=1592790 RepID=A0A975K381_9SPHN|nr:hypothetical protein [Sphingobium phenoxybenzoativorans]QUT04056.1 hypothetical protein KFK14_12955 [Sphingobium phenoxybenzoativorans]